jgi:hypothetical protein
LRQLGSDAYCAETNSSDINDIDGAYISFAKFGGTGVSGRVAKLLARETHSEERRAQRGVNEKAPIQILVEAGARDFPAARSIQLSRGAFTHDLAAKHPVGRLAPNGLNSATRDEAVIRKWFSETPWNIGIVTGLPSGIVVVDIDPRHDGDRSLAALEQEHGPLPPTCRFNTGGGGQHILFRHPRSPVPNSAGTIAAGIDVRGDGGYIVAPPSTHISGGIYSISNDAEFAPLPDWILSATKKAHKPTSWRELADVIPEGQRNDTLTRLSGLLLGCGIDPHTCLDLVLAYNEVHCNPPLTPEEVACTVANIACREFIRRPRTPNKGGSLYD